MWNDASTVLTDFGCEFVDKIFYRGNRFITLTALAYAVEDGKFRDGTSYSDVNAIPASPVVRTIGLRAGSRVDQVSLALADGTSFVHGGTGGTARSLTVARGEYVTTAELRADTSGGRTRIFYARFTTSSGAGDELDKVGVVYAPVQ